MANKETVDRIEAYSVYGFFVIYRAVNGLRAVNK